MARTHSAKVGDVPCRQDRSAVGQDHLLQNARRRSRAAGSDSGCWLNFRELHTPSDGRPRLGPSWKPIGWLQRTCDDAPVSHDGGHLFVFVCAGCGAELTTPPSQVGLPVHAHQKYGNGIQLPVLMESGTFATDPEPWGPPWRTWEEIHPDEAAARGVYAPVHALSDGAPGAIVIAPGDGRRTVLIPENRGGGYCCGLDGADGPNVACAECALPVASRIDDCSLWQAMWLAPNAVRRVPVDGADAAPLSWTDLMAKGKGTPPFEPIAAWGSRAGAGHWSNYWWSWSPQWEAAAGRALAHLLVASEGRPVIVPDGSSERCSDARSTPCCPRGRRRGAPPWPARDSLLPTGVPTSSSCRPIRRRGRPGPRPTRRRTRCHCRSGCGCGWSPPSRTCPFPRRATSLAASSVTTSTRSRCSPVACSGPTRKCSGTPSSGCRPSASRGCANSSTASHSTGARASSSLRPGRRSAGPALAASTHRRRRGSSSGRRPPSGYAPCHPATPTSTVIVRLPGRILRCVTGRRPSRNAAALRRPARRAPRLPPTRARCHAPTTNRDPPRTANAGIIRLLASGTLDLAPEGSGRSASMPSTTPPRTPPHMVARSTAPPSSHPPADKTE